MRTTLMFFTKDNRGGMDTFLNQMRMLGKENYEIIICLYKRDSYVNYKKNTIFLSETYPLDRSFSFLKCWYLIKNIYRTYQIVNKEKPNIIISFSSYSYIILSIVKLLSLNQISLVSIFNNNIYEIISRRPGFLYKQLLFLTIILFSNFPDRFVFTSRALAKNMSKRLNMNKNKIIIIPHSVDLKKTHLLSKYSLEGKENKSLIAKNLFNIFSTGRLEEQKDYHTLLRAFSIIAKKNKSAHLFIIGDGEQKEELKRLARELQIEKKVLFLGWKTNIYKYLKHADLFIFSSFYEGFGMVIVEAMALGIPVVATDSPFGPSEILENGKYGFIVPVADEKKMAQAALRLVNKKKLRNKYSKLSQKRAKDYDVREMLKKYELLYQKVLHN